MRALSHLLGRSPPPPFIDTRRGGVHARGDQNSSSSPRIGVRGGCVLWKVHYGALESKALGVAVVLGGVLGLAEIASASSRLSQASWRLLLRVPSSVLGVAERRGPSRRGLALDMAQAAFEGRAHANRGFCSRESARSRQHSGGSSAGHVRTERHRFPQCRCSAGDDRAVTGVGGQDSGHGCCAAW